MYNALQLFIKETDCIVKKRDRIYRLNLLRFFAIILLITALGLPFLIGIFSTVALLYTPCAGQGPNPVDFSHHAEDITLQARSGEPIRAYFIPGSNGATIIIAPTLANSRGGRWAETLRLLKNGYGILTYDSRRCAGMGPLSLGYKEVDEVAVALAYLQQRPDVDPERIGLYGFSQAGATSIMAAAQLPGIKAVVAEGGYGDFVSNALGTTRRGGVAGYFEWGYRQAFPPTYRLITGLDLVQLSPVSVIDQISPRPILLIYGSKEITLSGAYEQQAAAGPNAQLWVVEGAGHGEYLAVAGEAYEARVVGFFEAALVDEK